jgi:hypothetical protein
MQVRRAIDWHERLKKTGTKKADEESLHSAFLGIRKGLSIRHTERVL